jgi:hypothetical protein
VQNAQRFALIGTAERQCGHSFVVGAAGAGSSFLFRRFTFRMSRKTAKATMRKLMIVLMKTP